MDLIKEMTTRIETALPGATVNVEGGGGHFTIDVVASQFTGKNTLAKKRLVYAAIKDLMAGDRAPVHAIDRLDTRVP